MDTNHLKEGTILYQRYVIHQVLGVGGFGIIYSAFDTLINSMVSVKEFYVEDCMSRSTEDGCQVIFSTDEKDENRLKQCHAMFLHEIQVMQQIKNVPYTPRMKNSFSENGTEYIVMSLIKGKSLMDIVQKKGKLKPGELFPLLETVVTAIKELHKLDIIHRDISPGNMLLHEDGDLYLIDFGGATSINENSPLWYPQVVEHIGFQSPEYRSIRQQGCWTDVYSLCAVIIYLLSGEGVPDPADRTIYDDLSQRILHLSLSGKQQNVLRKGLQINPSHRYDNVKQFYEELCAGEKRDFRPKQVHYCAGTQIGDRQVNQDNLMVDGLFYYEGRDFIKHGIIECEKDELHIVAVCDGVGGSQSGELASRAAVQALDHFIDYFRNSDHLPERLIEEQLDQMNEKIITLGEKIGTTATTVSLLVWKKNQYYIANIGDSPIFLKRGFRLSALHTPHTKARAHELEGKPIQLKDKHTLMNYLGRQQVAGSQLASFRHGYIKKGDTFLLCSDGITNMIDTHRLNQILGHSEKWAIEKIYKILKPKAKKDNCSAIILKF